MKTTENNFNPGRRSFLKTSAALAATAAVGDVLIKTLPVTAATYDGENSPDIEDATFKYVFSVCQNCHSRCGIVGKVKVTSTGHELVKIEGNPYHPNNLEEDERAKYTDDVFTTINSVKYLTKPGRLCPKCQAGMQVLYNPYRIKHPLKRVGNRGSGQWKTISWATAFDEISTRMKALVTPWDSRLTTPIIASDAALKVGPIANHVMFSPGRSTDGDIINRFFQHGIGTKNERLDHTSICEVSHHIAIYLMTQYDNSKVGGGKNNYRADIENSRFLILIGENPLEANFPMLALSRKIVDFKKKGGKMAVVDPRFTKTASKADYWVPVKPGTDGAFALGLCRYLIDNAKYDSKFLSNCNAADAAADFEKSFSDAAFLVVTDAGTSTVAAKGLFLTPAAIGGSAKGGTPGGTGYYCYYSSTTSLAVEVGAAVTANVQLEASDVSITDKNGATVKCSTVFSLIKAEVQSKTLQQYADICGIDVSLFTTLGVEFAAAGKKACANAYRGTVQHTNGLRSQMCVNLLNVLVGNFDWKGGNSFGGGSYSNAKSAAGTVETATPPSSNSGSVKGVRIDRGKYSKHADTFTALGETLGNPKRPWSPMAYYGLYQEIVPSIYDQYPYPCKVLFTYWNALPYSTPATKGIWATTMTDGDTGDPDSMPSTAKVPLFVAIDPEIGEASSWADYILPDTTYLERFSIPGGTPTILTKFSSVRQPMVGTWDNETNFVDFGDRYVASPTAENNYYCWMATKGNTDDSVAAKSWPKMFEDILTGLALKLGIPGFGTSYSVDGTGKAIVHNAWDASKILIENMSKNNIGTVTTATAENILRKGGVFADPGTSHTDFAGTASDGDYLKSQFKNLLHLYHEQFITFLDSTTNQSYDSTGIAKYETIKGAKGTAIADSANYPYNLITYKLVEHGQARTVHCPFLTALVGENGLDISTSDAKTLGLKNGDYVKVTSASGTFTAPDGTNKVKVIVKEGLRPGVVAFSHHFGHWELSSRAGQTVDSTAYSYDTRRGKGVQLNSIMRTDPDIATATSLQDKLGGSVAFHDTWVKIETI